MSTKHESKTQPGLFFWAERNRMPRSTVVSWCVMGQAEGGPATEAHDDWFANEKDANEIARELAGEKGVMTPTENSTSAAKTPSKQELFRQCMHRAMAEAVVMATEGQITDVECRALHQTYIRRLARAAKGGAS